MDEPLASLPRQWWSIALPGYRPHPERLTTYSAFAYEELPPIPHELDDDLGWLSAHPSVAGGLEGDPVRPATAEQLRRLLGGRAIPLPASFRTFIESPQPRRRVRSCTGCYLDLADFVVPVAGGGWLVHFLSDSQWVLHWLLYVDDSREGVLVTEAPVGFEVEDETIRSFDPASDDGAVCATSFSEFIYRFWIENAIWFALVEKDKPLTDEQRRYAGHYRRPPHARHRTP
jgi:hypothetical protein